jgi:hypothetical protein
MTWDVAAGCSDETGMAKALAEKAPAEKAPTDSAHADRNDAATRQAEMNDLSMGWFPLPSLQFE